MSRPSPGVHRIASILDFMASHPRQSFSLTDLVRALKLSRATCHSILTSLVDVGYLYRTSDKSYVLGPGIAALGEAANRSFSPLVVARPEMRKLADEFDVVCSAAFLDDHHIEIREQATAASHVGHSVPVGSRLKLRVPLAAVYLAPLADNEIEAWMNAADPQPTEEQVALQWQAIEQVRKTGFDTLVRRRTTMSASDPQEIFGGRNMDFPNEPIAELRDGETYPVVSVLAPVLNVNGRVEFALGLMGLNGELEASQVRLIGERLRAACDRISNYHANAA